MNFNGITSASIRLNRRSTSDQMLASVPVVNKSMQETHSIIQTCGPKNIDIVRGELNADSSQASIVFGTSDAGQDDMDVEDNLESPDSWTFKGIVGSKSN